MLLVKSLDTIYHVGNLAVDREARGDDGQLTGRAAELDDLADRLWRAARRGKVILYQRRHPQGWEYHSVPVRGA